MTPEEIMKKINEEKNINIDNSSEANKFYNSIKNIDAEEEIKELNIFKKELMDLKNKIMKEESIKDDDFFPITIMIKNSKLCFFKKNTLRKTWKKVWRNIYK